jgi:thiamine pyrophosphokinase
VLIAADGGMRHLRERGLWPDVVIGDLDSMSAEMKLELQRADCKVLSYPEMKDETDLELALRYAADNHDDQIVILGALGGRLDQLLANIYLLIMPFIRDRKVTIADAYQEAWILPEGRSRVIGKTGDIVSLLPLGGDVQIEHTSGLAWPLADDTLLLGRSRGISNRMTADCAWIEVKNGTLLCIHLAEKWGR